MAPANKPAIGDISAEGTAAGSAGIPLDSGVVARGDAIFTQESKGKTTNEVSK